MKKTEVLDEFFKDLNNLKREKSFEVDIMEAIELLEKHDGHMPNHTTIIQNHHPLKELRYKDVRIFYRLEKDIILVVGVLKKDMNRFPPIVFTKMNKRK